MNFSGIDRDEAAELLEGLAQERLSNAHSGLHLARLTEEAHWSTKYTTVTTTPGVQQLALKGNNGSEESEEYVAKLHGIICKMDMPPINDRIAVHGNKGAVAKYLRQSVALTGFGTDTFNRAIEGISEIHAFFSREVPAGKMDPCAIISYENNRQIVEASNRYFTPKKDAGNETVIVLSTDIDPRGYLRAIAGTEFVHIDDNCVEYYERQYSEARGYSFVKCKPIRFRIGDVVEAQVSFALLPLRGGRYKSTMVLRALTLLDGTLAQKQIAVNAIQSAPSKPPSLKKRRVGYGEETMLETQDKLDNLEIGQSSKKQKPDDASHQPMEEE